MQKTKPSNSGQWFVVQTKPRQEERAQYFLAQKGFKVYLPKMEVVSMRGFRRILTQKALFPNYIFAYFNQAESLAHVRWTEGVAKILPVSNRPQSVDDEIVEGIMRLAPKKGAIRRSSLKRKDKIRIARGPLKDLLGIFENWSSDRGCVRVFLSLVNYQASVELHHSMVEKIS